VWVRIKWQHFSPDVIQKRFKKCCISSVVEWNGDDMFLEWQLRMAVLGGVSC